MNQCTRSLSVVVAAFVITVASAAASATPSAALDKPAATCQAKLGKALLKFKKSKIKAWTKCLDATLAGKACDAAARDAAITKAEDDAAAAIEDACTSGVLLAAAPAGVGFAASCALKSGDLSASEQACAALPASTNAELANCLLCWKETEIDRLLESVYPCLSATIPDGGKLQCGTPPASCPDPMTAGDDVKCLRAIGKAATKYFLAHEKSTEKCLDLRRSGKITDMCPDAKTTEKIGKAADKSDASIAKACAALPSYWDDCPVDATATCGDPIGTVAQLAACVLDDTDELSRTLVCEQYPDADADGLTCPPTCIASSSADLCDGIDNDCDVASVDGSEDPLTGSSCDGADADLCFEGNRACASGSLVCGDTSGDNVETCNLLDDDCDGSTDENFPENTNPACGFAPFVRMISGDSGSEHATLNEMNERWYLVGLREDSAFSDYLSAQVTLYSPPGVDFDLYVYCPDCGGVLAGSSENSAGVTDTVNVRREDTGADDTFYFVVEVRYFTGHSCGGWYLDIYGNTTASVTTCP